MTEKPILFSGPMVRAILDGPKTQTRRGLKLRGYKTFTEFQPSDLSSHHWTFRRDDKGWCDYTNTNLLKLLPFRVGDRLWVREAWRAELSWQSLKPSDIPQGAAIFYEADGSKIDNGMGAKFPGKLRPSMFMPRWASRITLEVTAVKVERLQDIREADCLAEGAKIAPGEMGLDGGVHVETDTPCVYATPRAWYRELWESINGPGSWDANPWVAAYTFRRVTE